MVELLPNFNVTHKKWWLLVALSITFLVFGQTSAILLGRFYYSDGGSSMFLATLLQTAGFPIICIPLILIPTSTDSSAPSHPANKTYIMLIYVCLGVLLAGDNLLYSVGLSYLSSSTYSLISATQLVFNALFSYYLYSQKFTSLILNSLVVVTISSGLLAASQDSSSPAEVSKLEYAIGFLCTIGASAVYALLLCLMQLSFHRVVKAETLDDVMKMQIYTSLVATVVSIGGLFASGQWQNLGNEMDGFDSGKASYIMTLVWTGITCQISSVAVVGLVFLVSSLFSNVISTAALAATPIASMIVFHDTMNAVKALAMLLAIWGCATYSFQNYLDRCRSKTSQHQTRTPPRTSTSEVLKTSSSFGSLV